MKRLMLAFAVVAACPAALAAQFRLPVKMGELEQMARRDSNDAAAHYNLSLAYWNAKRWDDVERELRTAVTIEPQFAEGWLALSRLPFARRLRLWDDIAERRVTPQDRPTVEQAYRLYQRAILINPLVDLRTEAAARPGKSPYWMATEALQELYDRFLGGFDDIETGNYASAFNRFDRIVQEAPTRGDREALPEFVYYFRGLSAAHINRWDEAIADFERLLAKADDRQSRDSLLYYIPVETNQYRYMLGVLNHRAGRLADAEHLYRTVVENDIGIYMAHARLAAIAESKGDWPTAASERRAAVNANPDDPSLLLDLGRTLSALGDFAAAEEALKQGVAGNPRDSRGSYYLGIVQQQLNKKEEARAAFSRFISLAPSRYARQIEDAKQRLIALGPGEGGH
jgi:tetratricopeptide (TPR) repeat protein